MNDWIEGSVENVFGVPAVLTRSEAKRLASDLHELWILTFQAPPAALVQDLQRCKYFFDPVARGQSLRERLAALVPGSDRLVGRLQRYGYPLVTDVGDGILLIGVEGRILLDLLDEKLPTNDIVVFSSCEVAAAEHRALELYRSWATSRLNQVIDLRSGRGAEVMQGIAVGVTLALMVNRADSPERAVLQRGTAEDVVAQDVSAAIFAGAEGFAEIVSAHRNSQQRSSNEYKMRGGYGFTEARRRLAHRMATIKDEHNRTNVYIPGSYRDEVVRYLGKDLARRESLEADTLETAFDELVRRFHERAGQLARVAMSFDRPADTHRLRRDLMAEFKSARRSNTNATTGRS